MKFNKAPALLATAFLAAAFLFVHEASLRAPISAWLHLLSGSAPLDMEAIILVHGLFPRAAVAFLAGAALGLSGALLQQLLRNPIADPSTLGISAGAQLAIVAATLYFPEFLDGHRSIVALSGAAIAAALVFALGWRRAFEPVTMVVCGLLVGVTAAAFSAALTLGRGEYLMSLVVWNGGSLSQQDWSVARALLVPLIFCGAFAALLLRPLLLLGLGDAGARSLGVRLKGVRFAVAGIATVLAGFVAANVGLVSFVGLAAPAFVRGCGVRRPAAVIGLSPLAGGLFLWFCDGAVQLLANASSETFPTGAVTALLGGPLLLWLLPKVRAAELREERQADSKRIALRKGMLVLLAFLPLIVFLAFFTARTGSGWAVLDLRSAADIAPLRWPRLLAAAGAGGLLALTGATLQRLTGNAMASPEVIGVSGGAGLGFAAALSFFAVASPVHLVAGAALGGLAAMSMVLAFASRRRLPPEKLLLSGIAVGSFSSSVLSALMAAGDQRAWQILAWIGGSASTATPGTAIFLAILAAVTLTIALTFGRWLTILPLGPSMAQGVGLPVRSSRIVMLAVCGLATGAASLLVGPLSFVGLIAPHIAARAGFTTARDHLAGSFALGYLLMAFADFGARTATFPYELPLGLFAAMIGAPYLIWMVGRRP
ncbi:Fe3+-hydroxamate ABC transporter permease FhuB [Brucella endophytica]|uniref:Fe3+-hydroxamate ABC transporter permease FhuB n=1 Tax=Brucella endophytica TaxID=1963359 RepID=A0A916WCP6_9HYPH|nr:Fe(3+)-hydroxamate ABC transporter permease FhuB [Brucella endophytica]GGA86235.1 Fe3+-hydroxamate ABC transporter permease FhuB [Brucella endophytica]